MNIYTLQDRTPYTYFIRWNKLNLNYYGRRTAKGCHPEEFFISYFTSSRYVADVIAEYGMPDVIKIHKIFWDIDSCKTQEYQLLEKVNAASNPNWLNKTNGDLNFDTTGVTPTKYSDTQYRTEQTNLKKYGVKCCLQHNAIKEKIKQTNLETYGVDNVSKSQSIKDKKSNTCLSNHGVTTYFNHPNCRELTKQGHINAYGTKTYLESTKAREENSNKRKLENSLKYHCPYCNREIGGLANFRHYHGDKCKLKP